MTYLVGLKRGAATVLIADTAMTQKGEVKLGVLKTGLLFPGCVYGLCGDAKGGRRFINDCHAQLQRQLVGDYKLNDAWRAFYAFVAGYDFPAGRGFEMILCSRNSGASRMFHYTLPLRLVESQDMITLGTGKKLLDEPQRQFLSEMGEDLFVQDIPDPAFSIGVRVGMGIGLFLTQQSCGDEAPGLQDAGVGGVFHFVHQTAEYEDTQMPGVYLIARYNPAQDGRSYCWSYRVGFTEGALVIAELTEEPMHLTVSFDAACSAILDGMTPERVVETISRIVSNTRAQRVYDYLGLGTADEFARNALSFTYGAGDDVNWSGELSDAAKERLFIMLRPSPEAAERFRDDNSVKFLTAAAERRAAAERNNQTGSKE
jgi:hypothetical protein